MNLLVHGLAGYVKGGIETFVLNMAEHMSDKIVFDYVLEKNGSCNNIRMLGKGDTLFIEPKRHMLMNIISWTKLLIKRKEIDSAIYFNWYSMAWFYPVIIARILGYKVVIHAHNNNLHNCGFIQRSLHYCNRQIQKCMKIKRLSNSELSAQFFFDNRSAKMIYNAIDVDRFAYNEVIRKKRREKLGIDDKHVYGFAGRIAYQKNPLFLMDIFNEIQKNDPIASFLVCGEGDMINETMEKAKEYELDILFVGSVSEIQDYYQAMDVFILPSRFEGLGIVLIEAQCSGLPCIASADVIPNDTKVTDLLEFVSLNSPVQDWSKCAQKLIEKTIDRYSYRKIIVNSRFNILVEAKTLENTLFQ